MGGAEPWQDEIGLTIAGRYLVERLLGDGGTARVYAVRDQQSNRRVALKRSVAPFQRRQRATLLEREFHTLAQLAHPAIIEVYDFGVDTHGAFYTMELLDGQDLHDQGQLPWLEVCALLRDVASSLALLHARGLLHRDVSARNVRRTTSGQAKLIDFGAMTAFGVAKDVLGTPPFLAPEALQLQALDGRADLYALGALGYSLLCGVHAFPARRFRDLRDTWRSRPVPVSRYQRDVPPALNNLVLQLLALDRAARPHSAAEVMQRLCAIADLPVAEHALVSRAYLTTPTLLGRDAALVSIRRRMLGLARGAGATLLIQGESGTGRSRLLDACALEAKLVGACVVRAQAAQDHAHWSAARILVKQLVQLQPEAAEAYTRLSRDVLGRIIEEQAPEASEAQPQAAARSPMLRELRNFLLALSRVQQLVILVDDVDHIDEASAALLAAVAHETRRYPLVVALTIAPAADDKSSAWLRFLRLAAEPITVEPLVAEQTEALLRSVFGDVPGLSLAAGRVHALSRGKPADVLAFAQHMVDHGLARYEAGTWSLPLALGKRDLPDSLSAGLAARLSALSADALELCEALYIADADHEITGVANFTALTSHGDSRRVVRAFDELVLARVLLSDPERHRFCQRTFLPVVDGILAPARRRELHGRVADMLAECGGDVVRRAEHLLDCGREREALDLIDPTQLQDQPALLPLLKRALAAALDVGLPALRVHLLRTALVRRAAMALEVEDYRQYAPQLRSQLELASGLMRYRELDGVAEPERVARALRETYERHMASAEAERLLPVPEAIRSLVAFCLATRVMALGTFDRELLEDELPDLAPFAALSPLISSMEQSARINQQSLRGRFQLATEGYELTLVQLEEREKSGELLPEYARARFTVHYVLGMLDASRGRPSAETHATALARERSFRANAWRIRALLNVARGNLQEALRCRRRAELAVLREGMNQPFSETTAFSELQCYAICGDLTGIRQTNHSMAQLAQRFPGWRQFHVVGQCHELRLRGDVTGALALLEPMLAQVQPGVHASYACLAACHLQLLCDANRVPEAIAHAQPYLAACEREQLAPAGYVTHVAAADAFAKSGAHSRALEILEQALLLAHKYAHGGVCIGHIYEARARVALAMQDAQQFQHYAQLCAEAYGHGKNPSLSVKLARLFDASPRSEPVPLAVVGGAAPTASAAGARDDYATLHSRMLECADETERARCALTILLQQLASFTGYLFGVNEHSRVLLAKLPDEDADPGISRWLEQLVADELDQQKQQTEELQLSTDSGDHPSQDSVPYRYVDARDRTFEPLFLIRRSGDEERLAAVLIYEAARGGARRPTRELQEDLADQLLSHADVSGAVIPPREALTRTH